MGLSPTGKSASIAAQALSSSASCRFSPAHCYGDLSAIDAVSFFQSPIVQSFSNKFEEFSRIETNAVEKKKVRSPSAPHEGLIGLSAKARLRCFCDFAPQ